MESFVVGLIAGSIAAVCEVRMVGTYENNKYTLRAIAAHLVGVGLLMPYIDVGSAPWAKGLVVGVVLTLPFIILAIQTSRNAVIHTSLFAPVWGIAIAYACAYFA